MLLGNGTLKLTTASFRDLQQHATDLLTTSKYYEYHDNNLLPGKGNVNTRAAASQGPPTDNQPCDNEMIETIVSYLRRKSAFNRDITAWIRDNFRCPRCFSNSHGLEVCKAASSKWTIRSLPPQGGDTLRSTERPNDRNNSSRQSKNSGEAQQTKLETTTNGNA